MPDEEAKRIPLAFQAGFATAPLRILVVADAFAATQHISFVQPLADRCARGVASLAVIAERDFDDMATAAFTRALKELFSVHRPTVVVFSRTGTRFAGVILAQAGAGGARIVTHLDDDLFAVPNALGASKSAMHNDPARLARLTIVCRRANVIYASTPALGDLLAVRFPDRTVIRGQIYATAREPFQNFSPRENVVFGYMGTAGHAGDLEAIAPAIASVLERLPAARFETFGTIKPPVSLAAFGERVVAHPRAVDYAAFMEKLKGLGWRAGLAPLNETPFNACRADTKFVEYAQAGIPAIVAQNRVYQRPLAAKAAISASSPKEWAQAIIFLLEDDGRALQLAQAAQVCLRKEYTPGALEAQLIDALDPEI